MALIALAASLGLLFYRGTTQILGRLSCTSNPLVVNVAVSPDIAPVITRLAVVFNRQDQQAQGRCVAVQITPQQPGITASQVDGQHPVAGATPVDAWIPDSSLWVDLAHNYPAGQQAVQPAGYSVARSPLLLVMPAAAASRIPEFGKLGWRLLLPQSAGGPVTPPSFRVDLPDPTQNAAGLSALIEIARLLGPGPTASVSFTRFIYNSAVTPYFDDPASLASFVSQAAPGLDGDPVTVTSEQAVLAYDQGNPRQPLAASYPAASDAALGTPELDYPYVTTTSQGVRLAAVNLFGQFLQQPYASSMIRYSGFRSGSGVPDRFSPSFGLSRQLLQVASAAMPSELVALKAWTKLALQSRDLTLLDISSAMNHVVGPGSATIEQDMAQTAALGLALFPDGANIGLWEYSTNQNGTLPYKQLVSVGPLSASVGLTSRRTALQRINQSVTATSNPNVAMYGSILAGYQYLTRTYQPGYFNALIVLSSGVENAPGDISARALIKKLTKLYDPAKPVPIVIIVFGNPPAFAQLKVIAATTGGQAYAITSPKQVAAVFFKAIAHRLCAVSCARALSAATYARAL